MHENTTNRNPRRSAFTLIELLVVLALIALIIGILLVAMGGVRSSVRRTESSNALRQMVAAYNSYSSDHNMRLMPGFVQEQTVIDLNIIPRRADGSLHTAQDSQGYVWRLAPYLGNKWETTFIDYGSSGLLSRVQSEYEDGIYGLGTITLPEQFGIARLPSFGLNSIFLGGDDYHCLTVLDDFDPWNVASNPPVAATRASHVKNPARMIVFAPTKQANPAFNPTQSMPEVEYGYAELRPPFVTLNDDGDVWGAQQWELAGDGFTAEPIEGPGYYNSGGGIPISRWGSGSLPVANLDGSISSETLTSISNDMTRWSHRAKGHFSD